MACMKVDALGGRADVYGPLGQRMLRIVHWLKQRAAGLQESGHQRYESIWSGGQVAIPSAVLGTIVAQGA